MHTRGIFLVVAFLLSVASALGLGVQWGIPEFEEGPGAGETDESAHVSAIYKPVSDAQMDKERRAFYANTCRFVICYGFNEDTLEKLDCVKKCQERGPQVIPYASTPAKVKELGRYCMFTVCAGLAIDSPDRPNCHYDCVINKPRELERSIAYAVIKETERRDFCRLCVEVDAHFPVGKQCWSSCIASQEAQGQVYHEPLYRSQLWWFAE